MRGAVRAAGAAELAHEARKLAVRYNQALLVVERNNHGSGVIAYLNTTERYARQYEQERAGGMVDDGGEPG